MLENNFSPVAKAGKKSKASKKNDEGGEGPFLVFGVCYSAFLFCLQFRLIIWLDV